MSEARAERPKLLIVDDVPANLDLLYQALTHREYTIFAAPDGEVALRLAAEAAPDLILLDLLMPGLDGLETCRRLKANPATREIPVIFLTAVHEKGALLAGFREGGVDFILKPVQTEETVARIETHLRLSRLTRDLQNTNARLQAEIARREQVEASLSQADAALNSISEQEARRWGLAAFVGASPRHAELLATIRRLQPVNTPVLITGESGTGKELVARALHFGGPRAKCPFIAVNCAAIARDGAESELFGHVRGAFTGATTDRKGAFELAHGGTLFLDEVGELPPPQQAKLLRALESRSVWRLGAQKETTVDVRLIAATNADLEQRMRLAGFREDLYFRLAHYVIRVAPLRERAEDIPLLAVHFAQTLALEIACRPPVLTAAILERLLSHSWPGNVRELRNVIERALIECDGGPLRPSHLNLPHCPVPPEPSAPAADPAADPPQTDGLPWNLADAELVLIRRALKKTSGNLSAAATLLGVDRGKLYRRLNTHPPEPDSP